MGQAMIGGIIESGIVASQSIIVCDLDQNKVNDMKNTYQVAGVSEAHDLVEQSDIIVLAVKPHIYDIVLNAIKKVLRDDHLIVTIAAGRSINSVETIIGKDSKIIRTMPNTPALVGEAMSALCPNANVTTEEIKEIKSLFESFGHAEIVKEHLIDSVIGVAGSAPAYFFMMIEAMGDAAVLEGMPREQAYKFAAQAMLGSAKMVLETDKHPGALKDMVCSPGGTTIEAVATLERTGFRSAIIEAMTDCINKSKAL